MRYIVLLAIQMLIYTPVIAQLSGVYTGDTRGMKPLPSDCFAIMPLMVKTYHLYNDGSYKYQILIPYDKAGYYDSTNHIIYGDDTLEALIDTGIYKLSGDTIKFISTVPDKQIININTSTTNNSDSTHIHISHIPNNASFIPHIFINDTIDLNHDTEDPDNNFYKLTDHIVYPKGFISTIEVVYLLVAKDAKWKSKVITVNNADNITITYNTIHNPYLYIIERDEYSSWTYHNDSMKNAYSIHSEPILYKETEH